MAVITTRGRSRDEPEPVAVQAPPMDDGTRCRWLMVAAALVGAAVPLTIAASRVYRGMHYPTDVLAGGLLGAIWLTVVIFYVRTHDAGGSRDAAVDADTRLVTR